MGIGVLRDLWGCEEKEDRELREEEKENCRNAGTKPKKNYYYFYFIF